MLARLILTMPAQNQAGDYAAVAKAFRPRSAGGYPLPG